MLDRTQWYMSKIAEEAAEVSQRAMKAQQFGLGEIQPGQRLNNLERFVDEMHDLIATYQLMCEEIDSGIAAFPGAGRVERRRQKMSEFLDLSRALKQVS